MTEECEFILDQNNKLINEKNEISIEFELYKSNEEKLKKQKDDLIYNLNKTNDKLNNEIFTLNNDNKYLNIEN